MERKLTFRIGAPEKVRTSIIQDVVILDRKISEVESEVPEAEERNEGRDVDRGGREGVMCSAGGSQKKREAAVRRDSVNTKEHKSCQHHWTEASAKKSEALFQVRQSIRLDGMSPISFSTGSAVKEASSFMTSQPYRWKVTEDRTRSTSGRIATS